ncbi:hypothetical protein B0J11DRAFT_91045 [Dendryphion nanum]|uniref:Peptidase M43 pregnancy-associated plasma-A domain-containing protein n=1 Tax=Dendryphion nanum TaxID=256645 RepID=A0A9P9DF21_9PLEO|nr:hypothetical protein B0J11DRAFT_91045 [Dendryphion nanum]
MIRPLLLASLGLLAAAANPQPKPFDCGTDTAHASDDFLKIITDLHSNQIGGSLAARAGLVTREKDNNSQIEVDAVFHIVAKPEHKGDITHDMPQAQLDSINESYKDYGISFKLINVTWNTNEKWAVGAGDSDLEMKKALRQGTYRTLNIYFQTDLTGGVLGRCTLPSNVGKNTSPSVYANDGCNVNANTMPDGPMDGFNKGKTAVHETGHWLGLLHTFEGYSCDGPGDFIDDTPRESQSTEGCPESPPKRSCPNQSGDRNDPIHNYMDYSIDSCYTGFTSQQHDRMHAMYNMYRDGN